MDFSELDVYNKDKFVLRSFTRSLEFPFIRYNGKNYEELKSFLSAYSPNIVINQQELKIGELYSFSGKYFNLKRIPISELRFVIISNPYLVKEDGECVPLTLDLQQSEDYLKENRHHKLFTYKNSLATYKYNPEYASFMMYDASHPTGVPLNRLPESYEWYIGGDDGANRLWKSSSITYDDAFHTVDIRPSFGGLLNRIENLEHRINQKLSLQGRPVLFNESWESHSRRQGLKKLCQKKTSFKDFVSSLHIIVTQETKSESPNNTNPFSEFADEPIVKTIEGLHDYYVFGRDSQNRPVSEVFRKYLEHNLGPQEPNDYSRLQEGILTDYYGFLKKIYESLAVELTIDGVISQDENGTLYCGQALLSQELYIYRGCKCVITTPIKNPDEKTASKYPYYSDKLNSVALNRSGIISKDEEGTFYLDSYIIKEDVSGKLGEEAQLKQIRPFLKPRGQYLGEVSDYVLSKDVSKEDSERVMNHRILVDKEILHWPTDKEFESDSYSRYYFNTEYFTETIFGLPGQVKASDVEKLFNMLTSMMILDDDIETKLIFLARYSGKRIPHLELKPMIWRMPDTKNREKTLAYLIHMTAGGDSKFVKGSKFFCFEDDGKEVRPDSRVMGPAAHRWENRGGNNPDIRRTQFEKTLNKFLKDFDIVV